MRYRTWTLLSLMLASPAQALDIEPITIRSALGYPLLAEIPIKASPDELRELRVGLAAPVVFARVGLARPQGTVADLRFSLVDTDKQALIRVTTERPVTEAFFTFLVQLEWHSRQMIREFSVALQEPASMPIAKPPAISLPKSLPISAEPIDLVTPSPAAAPIEVIMTRPSPRSGANTTITQEPARPAMAIPLQAASRPPPPAQTRRDTSQPIKSSPAPSSVRSGAPARPHVATHRQPSPAHAEDRYGPVKPGETLSRIATRIDTYGASHEQALVALLLANPDAFIGGNINRLRRDAVLQLPSPSQLASIPAPQAQQLVHLQIRAWRQGPDSPAPADMSTPLAALQAGYTSATADMDPTALSRLEISPAEPLRPSDTSASTQPPAALAADADDAPVELLASREAEIAHLRQRVATLESANEDMQHVIAIQDQALANAQTRLAQADPITSTLTRSPWSWAAAIIASLALAISLKRRRARSASGVVEANVSRWPRWHRPGALSNARRHTSPRPSGYAPVAHEAPAIAGQDKDGRRSCG